MPENAEHEKELATRTSSPEIDPWLRRLAATLPGVVKFRLLNSLDQFDRSFRLLDTDKEMASFRGITGEEEAATVLIKAIQLRSYPHAREFNARDHQHKAAVIACVMAIAAEVAPLLAEFQLTFDFEKKRADVKMPLSNFGIVGADNLAIQPVEPLDLAHRKGGTEEAKLFDAALANLAGRSNFENIKRMVSAQANARNTLLFASDSALPESKATREHLENRKKRALILLVLAIMVLQTRKHQSLVCQATLAFLGVISKLPPPEIE